VGMDKIDEAILHLLNLQGKLETLEITTELLTTPLIGEPDETAIKERGKELIEQGAVRKVETYEITMKGIMHLTR